MTKMPYSPTLDFKHTFNFSQATLIKFVHFRKSHQLLEYAIIFHSNHTIKHCPGFFHFSPNLADIIL